MAELKELGTQTDEDKELIGLDLALWKTRADVDQIWQDVADYVVPELEDILNNQQPGRIRGQKIYDGTARQAAELYTNGIYGNVINQATPWLRLKVPDKQLSEIREVKLWFDEAEKGLYNEFDNSNFYREMWPFILHGATIGLGGIGIVDDFMKDRILYPHINPSQLAISQGIDGRIDMFSREERQEVKWFVERFGEDNVSDSMRDLFRSDPFKIIKAHNLVMPRALFDPKSPLVEDMPFSSTWIYEGAVFFKSGFRYFPAAFWRHTVSSPDFYGSSPATKMMPDIKTLNTMGKTLLKTAALASEPPMNVHTSQQGIENFVPGGFNYFKNLQDQASRIDMAGDYPIGIEREQARQDMINRGYSVDFFLSLAAAQRQMTAAEVAERQAEKSVVLAPEVSRFTWEPLEPLIMATLNIAIERGRIPAPPAILQEIAGTPAGRLEIDFIGPLVEAQQRLLTGRPIQRTLASAIQLREVKPDVMDNFDIDAIVRADADINFMPERLMRDEKAVAKMRDSRAKLQARQAQGDQALQASETVKNLADASPAVSGAMDQAVEAASG